MFRYLQTQSIKRLMRLAVAAPCLIALALALVFTWERALDWRELSRMDGLTKLTQSLANTVHEQQKERGATSIYLNSGGTSFATELSAQRKLTDARTDLLTTEINRLSTADMPEELINKIKVIQDKIGQMQAMRDDIDGLGIPIPDALGYYTGLNADMLSAIGIVGAMSTTAEITSAVHAFSALLAAKERAGIERAVASGAFAAGTFPVTTLLTLQRLIAQQNLGFAFFRDSAQPHELAALAALENMPDSQEVERMRAVAFAFPNTQDTQGITAQHFFGASTVRINALKTLEDQIASGISDTVSTLRQDLVITFAILASGSLVVLVLSALVFRHAMRVMLGTIDAIATAARDMSTGDLNAALPQNATPELAPVILALDRFRTSILDSRADTAKAEEERTRVAAEAEDRRQEYRRAEDHRLHEEAARNDALRAKEQQIAQDIAKVVQACAEGDFSRRLDLQGKEGAYADICKGVNQIGDVVAHGLNAVQAALDRVAAGDMTHRMPTDLQGAFGDIAERMNETTLGLGRALARVVASSGTVGTQSSEIAQSTDDLSRRSERNAAMLEETTAALQEMSDSVTRAADAAKEARNSVTTVSTTAQNSDHIVKGSIDAMEEIREASESIERVLSVIDEIAFQTNLLALNAGVEAARAGDAGRGFAVVASEVRALAQRSSDSAREIASMIEKSADSVRRGVDMVNRSGTVLSDIAKAIGGVSTSIERITVTFEETKLGIQEITTATTELDRSTQQNSHMIEQTSKAIRALDQEATELAQEMGVFRLDDVPDHQTARTARASAA